MPKSKPNLCPFWSSIWNALPFCLQWHWQDFFLLLRTVFPPIPKIKLWNPYFFIFHWIISLLLYFNRLQVFLTIFFSQYIYVSMAFQFFGLKTDIILWADCFYFRALRYVNIFYIFIETHGWTWHERFICMHIFTNFLLLYCFLLQLVLNICG